MGYIEYALIIEEIAAVDLSIALSVAAHNSLGSNHIFTNGSEEQRKIHADAHIRRIAGIAGAHRTERRQRRIGLKPLRVGTVILRAERFEKPLSPIPIIQSACGDGQNRS